MVYVSTYLDDPADYFRKKVCVCWRPFNALCTNDGTRQILRRRDERQYCSVSCAAKASYRRRSKRAA